MAGVTNAGFVTKRFPEIIEDLREQAVPLFQDLVTPGEAVDTSDSTLLGRLIGLTTPSLTEVWEAMQEVYAAFDPNTSSGIALDNLVALSGTVRKQASPTTFSGIVWGDTYTEIPKGSLVRQNIGNNQFESLNLITLIPINMIGAGIQVSSVVVGAEYTMTFSSYTGVFTLTTTGLAGDTPADILNRFSTLLSPYSFYQKTLQDDTLIIAIDNHYSGFNISLGGELIQSKTAHRLEFSCITTGPVEISQNTVNVIVTPTLGWDSVNNPVPATLGTDQETDVELRERFRKSKYLRASNTADALYSSILELDGIEEVRLYINPSDLPDSIGLPPHSFKALVLGGSENSIAEVIWRHTPLGIASEGSQEVSVLTSQGLEQVVKFDRPVYVPIYVEVTLQTYGSEFPVGGDITIKQSLAEYITANQTIGGRVVYSRLFDPVNETPGHEIVSLKIGTNPLSLSETSINLAYNQIATINIDDIVVITS